MRKLIPILGFVLLAVSSQAQFVDLFKENFDGSPPYTVSTSTLNQATSVVTPNVGWSDTTVVAASNPKSFVAVREPFRTKILETDTFSTVGMTNVRLEFDHIAKIYYQQQGKLEYTVDSGQTWHRLFPSGGDSLYMGNSNVFRSTREFSDQAYNDPGATPYWEPGNPVSPTNSWWAHEIFDLTPLMQDASGNGYPNCKIRWMLVDRTGSAGGVPTLAGWFIDNIEIVGANCELGPPEIKWNFAGAKQPIGPKYQFSQTIRFQGSDVSGIDSAVLYYSLNGAPDTTVIMTSTSTDSCALQAEYYHTISGLVIGDTVTWRVEVKDCSCPNRNYFPGTSSPSPYATFWIDDQPPTKCGSSSGGLFPLVVYQYPYVEDFENPGFWNPGTGTGNPGSGTSYRGYWPAARPPVGRSWLVAPDQTSSGYAWSVRTGPTATANTGPSSDHGSVAGGNYVYTEASQPFSGGTGQNTQMLPPCMTIPTTGKYVLEFAYHMYGSDIDLDPTGLGPGLLRVDIDTCIGMNTGPACYHNGKALILGQQQQSSNDPWKTAIVSLEEYSGQIIRFRFLGFRRHPGERADIAVDAIRVFEAEPTDIEMMDIEAPVPGYCSYTSTEDVTIRLRSRGSLDVDTIPVAYSIQYNLGPIVTYRDTIFDTLSVGEEYVHTFAQKADLSTPGFYEIKAWCEVPNDVNAGNDELNPIQINHIAPIVNYPYTISFDEPGWVYGNGTINAPGTFGSTDWEVTPPHTSADLGWTIGRELTRDFSTGPRTDFSGFGQYLYSDGRSVGNHLTRFQMTRCFDFTGMVSPAISYWYHMYGADIDALTIQAQENGELTWAPVTGSGISNAQQTGELNAWKWKKIDLSAFAGKEVRLRIIARSKGTGSRHDIAIDNLMVWDENGQSDVGAAYVTSPGWDINLDGFTTPPVTVMIQNYGANSVSNIPLNVTVRNACDNSLSNTYTAVIPGPIAPDAQLAYTLPATPTYFTGTNEIIAWTSLGADPNGFNDSTRYLTHARERIEIPYLNETFDSCDYDTRGWYTDGGLKIWQHGTPQKGGSWNSASSQPYAWTTGRRFNYQNKSEYLFVPTLTGFDTITNAQLRFRHRYSFGSEDGGNVEYNVTGTNWQQLGIVSNQVGSNWYDESSIAGLGGKAGWSGSSGGWVLSQFPLSQWNNNSSPLSLRFKLGVDGASQGTQGWSIDDFTVYIPPQHSVGVDDIYTKEYLLSPGRVSELFVSIMNTGEKDLTHCRARYRVSEGNNPPGPWTAWDNVNAPGSWKKFQTIEHKFTQTWTNNGPGVYTIEVETSRPNGRLIDDRPIDDTLSVKMGVLDEIFFTGDTTEYCNNFEDTAMVPWLPLHSYVRERWHDWEFGTPTQPELGTPISGNNAWVTRLDTNYTDITESALHTAFFNLDPQKVYELSFWHTMHSEEYHDGGTVQYSIDGGINWFTLGGRLPSGNWFNTEHITSMDLLHAGWSGDFDTTYSRASFRVDLPGQYIFRFRFTSDNTVTKPGWLIDDFCLVVTNDPPDFFIDIEENEADLVSYMSVYPNPADMETSLEINATGSSDAVIEVTDLLGQVLFSFGEKLQPGINEIPINTSGLSSGVYMITASMNGQQVVTRKLIVSR